MTIKKKFFLSTVLCITTLFTIGLIILYGYHYVTSKASLANDFYKESMYLQMMLRGLNELIINAGTPSELRTQKEGMEGFDEIHTRLLTEMKDPDMRRILIEEIDPEWKVIKADIQQFRQHYVDLEDDPPRIQADKLIIKTEYIIKLVRDLADKTHFVVNENPKKSAIVEKVIVIFLFAIILLSPLLAYQIYNSITRPIGELANIAERFNKGDLSIMMDESRRDEFGSLAKCFNRSTLKLNQTTKELQKEIAERKQSEEVVSHMAHHDNLTGLPNRYLFLDRLNMQMAHVKRHKTKAALLFLDIDDFKRINDTLGHNAGDLLLKILADKIKQCIRATDTISRQTTYDVATSTVARLGGDEFTILLTDIRDSQNAAIAVQRLMETISHPFKIGGNEIVITLSIGIAVCPDDGDNADTLLKNADAAMYHAKNQGKNNFQFYKKSMNALFRKRLIMENDLRKAIENNDLLLYYQPRIDVRTGNIVSMEALVRWKKPDKGLISPAEFIPVAEDTGLIIRMGKWILKTACEQNKAWQKSGLLPRCVSVNISGKQFQKENFITTISNVLEDSSLDTRYLELEVTESVLMYNAKKTVDMLKALNERGIRLSMDDFGTGYSSFSYLKRFPLDVIKIDKSFIDDIPEKSETAAIVTAIISMAHSLNLRVVAEGVETSQQLSFLRNNECDEFQGYYFSRPLPAEEFAKLLEEPMHRPLKTTHLDRAQI
jgi:diguanylate cyclase (GGDEF)-like protein